MKQTVMITGGTGLVGWSLANRLLMAGHPVIIFTRNPAAAKVPAPYLGLLSYAAWDVNRQTIDERAFSRGHALVHLAGAGVVAKPWTASYKQEIADSRIKSGHLLVKTAQTAGENLQTVVSASAIGWYGADEQGPGRPFIEIDPASPGFLGETCRLWEEAISGMTLVQKRLVILRIGIVLSNRGGALAEFKKPLRFRIAGIIGHGRQVVSWIHIEDLCGIITMALESAAVNGIFNAVAPIPVSNRELNLQLARSMYGSKFLPLQVPAFVLKGMLGARSEEILKSTTVSADKIIQAGYRFAYPDIASALQNLCSHKNS